MADSAFQRQYRQEFIAGFEKRQSLVRHTVVTETEVNGNEAIFLVADSGGATATTPVSYTHLTLPTKRIV